MRLIDPSCCNEPPTLLRAFSKGPLELSLETSVQHQMMQSMGRLRPASPSSSHTTPSPNFRRSYTPTDRFFTCDLHTGKPTRVLLQTSKKANTAATSTRTELFGIAYLKLGLVEHMDGEHIFISATTARLAGKAKAAQLSPEKLAKNFALVLPSDMAPNPQGGPHFKLGHMVGPCPNRPEVLSGRKSSSNGDKWCRWAGFGLNDEAPY